VAVLTRRELLKTGGAAAVVLGVGAFRRPASAQPPPGAWNHDPASPIGPLHWGDIGFPTCGAGMNQSPVDIRTGQLAAYHGSPLLLRYEPSELGIENTGHVVEVPIPVGVSDTLQINGDRYQLEQYHFGKILLAAPETAGQEVTAGEASPAELFRDIGEVSMTGKSPVRVKSFYAYDGSLTTPGCTQGVIWSVLASGGHVSNAAATRLHQLIARFPFYHGYPNNNRPVQPLNGRVIKFRR